MLTRLTLFVITNDDDCLINVTFCNLTVLNESEINAKRQPAILSALFYDAAKQMGVNTLRCGVRKIGQNCILMLCVLCF